MCGLCGEIAFEGTASGSSISAMAEAMRQRGPDAGGLVVHDIVGLGHRRLSIIDLEPASQQPMVDAELGLAIVFNGCIYNYRQLRLELEAKGYRFFSNGDTEVILKAYAAWGVRCVERFYGMFAFALWERDSGRVILARDRLGIKPLYIAEARGKLRFASTLPALLAAGDVDTAIEPAALHHYLSFHAAVPAPLTILKGVKKLPPATLLIIEPDGSRREEVYWKLHVGPRLEDRSIGEAEWRSAVAQSMKAAVGRHNVADVPVGVLLSGGLDSSLVTALLAQSGPPPKTFSIGFEAVRGVEGNEFAYSDLIARTFGTEHVKIDVDMNRTLEVLPAVIAAMSEPMMSHDSVGFYLLAEAVSKSVKVVQSGQGADEIFGGYSWYRTLMNSDDASNDYARVYFDRNHAEMKQTVDSGLLSHDYSKDFVDTFFANSAGAAIDKVLQLDAEVMMVEDPVRRVDNMTMAWGLEARVPFLDHEVVELAARIPAELKVRGGGKYILKEASRGIVPDAVIDRPKGYFPVPTLKYIRGPILGFVRDVLLSPASQQRKLFNPAYIEMLLADPEGQLTPKGHSKLWQAAVLESWLQSNGI